LDIFYHLDSTGQSLRPGQLLELRPLPDVVPPEEAALMAKWCPDGVARFGHRIICQKLEPLALARELEVECVRRELFPDRITRYAVVFGCRHLADIVKHVRWQFFYDGDSARRSRIWKIHGAAVFRADMNVFKEYCGDDTAAAHAYWSQRETKKPLIEYLLRPPVRVLEEVAGA